MSDQATKRRWTSEGSLIYRGTILVARAEDEGTREIIGNQRAREIVTYLNERDGLLAQNQAMREALELAQDFLIGAHLPRNDGGFIHNKINAALTLADS